MLRSTDDSFLGSPCCHGRGAEHAALLQNASGYDLLRRRDDLFDEGVATVFGICQGEAELHAFCFGAARFTPQQARAWLRERGLEPRHFRAAGKKTGQMAV